MAGAPAVRWAGVCGHLSRKTESPHGDVSFHDLPLTCPRDCRDQPSVYVSNCHDSLLELLETTDGGRPTTQWISVRVSGTRCDPRCRGDLDDSAVCSLLILPCKGLEGRATFGTGAAIC